MESLLGIAAAGFAAGLGVAMPLGAVSALLIREGVLHGLRVGSAAAAGVATVDILYCALALSVGGVAAPVIEGHRRELSVGSGVVLMVIGLVQLLKSLRVEHVPASAAGPEPATPRTSAARCYLRFVAVTLANPLTLLYFGALAGFAGPAGSSPASPIVFTAAVAVASLGWQLLLVWLGSVLTGGRLRRLARPISLTAALIVVALGMVVTLGGVVGTRGIAGPAAFEPTSPSAVQNGVLRG